MFIVVSVLFHKNWTIRSKGNKIKLDGFIIDIGCSIASQSFMEMTS